MTSQLLFGETVHLLEKYKNNWVRVISLFDSYEGWMDPKQLVAVSKDSKENGTSFCLDLIEPLYSELHAGLITIGAELPGFDGLSFNLAGVKFRFSGQAIRKTEIEMDKRMLVVKLARKLLNSPYLWGGRSPFGIDCSGFSQIIYKCAGIPLSRDSIDQANQGTILDFLSESRAGDLAFFTKQSENITHVGIILEDNKVIHASGKVRIDSIDHYGIFNEESKEYTHRLKMIKTILA